MAAGAVVPGRFLPGPMAVETRRVIVGRRFKRIDWGLVGVNPASGGRHRGFCIRGVTYLAVVIFLRLVIWRVR